jgi:glycosyltransferase involved in cell wall biosynthesis
LSGYLSTLDRNDKFRSAQKPSVLYQGARFRIDRKEAQQTSAPATNMSEQCHFPETRDDVEPICARHRYSPIHPHRRAEGGRRLNGVFPSSKSTQPLVSIVTVVRNGATTLMQCMMSVFAQSYDNIEYLIIDGDSSDGTLAVIEAVAERIDYYVSEPDGGLYDAMNKGLALAHGDYVLLLNADDWYRSDAVARLVDSAIRSGADVTHADARLVDARGRHVGTRRAVLHDGVYTGHCPLRHETMLVRSAIYNRFGGYDASYRVNADFVYITMLYEAGVRFCHVPETLLNFRLGGVSSRARELLEEERTRLFRTRFPFLDENDAALLNSQDLSAAGRLSLIDKHQGRSELFNRSLASNIVLAPEMVLAARLVVLARRVKRQVWSMFVAPLRRLWR